MLLVEILLVEKAVGEVHSGHGAAGGWFARKVHSLPNR